MLNTNQTVYPSTKKILCTTNITDVDKSKQLWLTVSLIEIMKFNHLTNIQIKYTLELGI